MASVLNSVLAAITTQVQGLGLTVGETAVAVVRRKVPGYRRGIDTLPQVQICCSGDAEESTPFDSGVGGNHRVKVDYRVWLVLMAAGDADAVSQEADLLQARQLLRKGFEIPGAGLPEGILWVLPQKKTPPLEPKAFEANLDLFALTALVSIIETAGN